MKVEEENQKETKNQIDKIIMKCVKIFDQMNLHKKKYSSLEIDVSLFIQLCLV